MNKAALRIRILEAASNKKPLDLRDQPSRRSSGLEPIGIAL
jgi:hypothetical protein